MLWIKYQVVQSTVGEEDVLVNKKIGYSEANIAIAEAEAYNGKYEVVEDGKSYNDEPLAIEFGGTGAKTVEQARKNIGAAPAGFGLGMKASWDAYDNSINIDDLMQNGWYVVNSSRNGANTPFDTGVILVVARDDTGFAHQIAFLDSGHTSDVLIRKRVNGYWNPWRSWGPEMFAPSGYGLGETEARSITSLDDITRPGWYRMWFNEQDVPFGASNGNYPIKVDNFYGVSDFDVVLYGAVKTNPNSELVLIRREKRHGVWLDWEWETPFLISGIEYRTTKKMFGLPVFQRIVSIGYLVAGTHQFKLEDVPAASNVRGINIRVYNNEHEDITKSSNIDVTFGRYADFLSINFVTKTNLGHVQFFVEYTKPA